MKSKLLIAISIMALGLTQAYTQQISESFLNSDEKSGFSFANGYTAYEVADLIVEPHCVDNPSLCGNYALVEGHTLEYITYENIPARGYLSDEAGYADCGELLADQLYVSKNKDGGYFAFVLTNHRKPDRCDHEMDIRYKKLVPGGGNDLNNVSTSDWEEVDVYEYNYRNWPNANWAEWATVAVGSRLGGEASSRRTYLIFDTDKYLSKWDGKEKVELEFWGDSRKPTGADISIYRVSSPWNPGTGTYISGKPMPTAQDNEITWNNQPNIDFTREWASLSIPANASYSNWRWDITDLVREWKNQSFPNYGLVMMIKGEGTVVANYSFSSSEHTKDRPRLVIGGDPATGSISSNKCSGDEFYGFIPDESISENATLSMPITICNATDLANMDVQMTYDPEVIALINVKKGSLIGNSMFQYNLIHPGKVLFSFAGSNAFKGSGSIAEMEIKAIKPAESYTSLDIEVLTSNSTNGAALNLQIADGSISITGKKGDCDQNGVMDERDVLAALQVAVSKKPFDRCYDMNDDGRVNSVDARLIMKSIVLIIP